MKGPALERIAHYRIEQRVGRGGMGIVYRAVDERNGRTVALKVIRETETAGIHSAPHAAEARVRFAREAEILKGLLHVNIVSFFEIGEDDGSPYLAMEFLDGLSIAAYAGRPFSETVPLLIQAAHGMEVLSSRGIVHRDLSPDNIFVVESGGERIVKLLDFGIAKLFERTAGCESLTATGFFLGKVAYGAPEQLGSLGPGAPLDWRSDVYSLGLIFYEVLAGRRPFEGMAPVEYIAAHLNHTPPPVAAPAAQPALPMNLVRLVSRMLEKRREDRPQSYREITDVLVSALRADSKQGTERRLPASNTREAGEESTHATVLVAGDSAIRDAAEVRKKARGRLVQTVSAVVALAAAAGLLVAATLFLESGGGGRGNLQGKELAKRDPVVAPLVSGTLQLLATPYANVLSITEEVSKRPLALPVGSTTPFVLGPIPAGRYKVVLRCSSLGGKQVERSVVVQSGQSALVTETFYSSADLVRSLGMP